MSENKVLAELEIKGTQEELDRLAKLNNEIETLKSKKKDITEQEKITLKEVQKSYREQQKAIMQRNQAAKDEGKTLDAMRARLASLRKELGSTEKVGTEAFKKKAAEVNALNEEIKEAEAQAGTFNRNVGNYSNDIQDAFKKMGVDVGRFTAAIGGTGKAIKTSTISVKAFGKALIATGIGAIAVAVGSLAAAFMSTEQGAQAVQKVLVPLRTIMQRLWGLVQELSVSLVDAFKDPKQAVKDLWESLKTNLLNRLKGFVNIFVSSWEVISKGARGVGAAVAGIFNKKKRAEAKQYFLEAAKGSKDLGNAILQFSTGIEDPIDKVIDGAKSIGKEMVQAAREGRRIADITVELKKLEIERAENVGRIRREMAEQRAILEDMSLTDEERIEAGERYLKLKNEQLEFDRRQAALELEKLELQAKQNDTSLEQQAEIARAREKLNEIEAKYLENTRMIQNQVNRIKQAAAEEDRKRREEEREERERMDMERMQREIEYNEWLEELNRELFETEKERLERELEEKLALIVGNTEKEIKIKEALQKKYNDKILALEKSTQKEIKKVKQAQISGSLAQLRGAANEQSGIAKGLFVVEKTAALGEATMDFAKGLQKSTSAAPFPSNIPLILGYIAQAAGIITSIKSVKGPKEEKFAQGVIGLDGPGSGTSDSIPARISAGESVMTAKATKAFAPILANMERAVGNAPNVGGGGRKFARGVVAAQPSPSIAQRASDRMFAKTITDAIAGLDLRVGVDEITEVGDRVKNIEVTGDLNR